MVVNCKGVCVGGYPADCIVEDQIIAELKCVDAFAPQHMAQAMHYLRAAGMKLALPHNFQKPKAEIKRFVLKL